MLLLVGCVDPSAPEKSAPDSATPDTATPDSGDTVDTTDTAPVDTSGCGAVLTAPWGEATWVTTELPDIAIALDVSADGSVVVGRNRMVATDAIPAVWRDGVTTLWPGDAYGAAEALLADGSWVEAGATRIRIHGPDDTVTFDWFDADYMGADDTALLYADAETVLRWAPGGEATAFPPAVDKWGPYVSQMAGRYAIGAYSHESTGPVAPALWEDQVLVDLDDACNTDCYEDVREDGTILRQASYDDLAVGRPGAWTQVGPDCDADAVTVWGFRTDGGLAGLWSGGEAWASTRPFVWDGATFTTLPVPEGMVAASASEVTPRGDTLGYAFDADDHRIGVVWRDGVPLRLDNLCPDPAPTTSSWATAPLGDDAFLLSCDPQDASGPFLLRVSAG